MNKKFVTSFSGGKDCMLSTYIMQERGYILDSMIIAVKEKNSWTHGISMEMIKKYEDVFGIKIYPIICNMNNYEQEFENTLKRIKKERDLEICVFGDIDIKEHLEWNKKRCKNSGMNAIMPLENADREKTVNKFIESGFKAIIKKVNLNYLDESFLGRELNLKTIEDIKRYGEKNNINIDLCGENGEYHTIVVDGKNFKKAINYKLGEISREYQSALIDVKIL